MNEICLKVLLIGDSSVGKTALIFKYIDGLFSLNHITTIGVEYRDKKIMINEREIKLRIWDTSGQEIYRSLTKNFYRNADALLFVFDITNEKSFNHINDWMKDSETIGKDFKKILIGNKSDLIDERKIDKEKIEKYVQLNNMKYFEVSAKSGKNVDVIFTEIAKLILEGKSEEEIMEQFTNNNFNDSSIITLDSNKSIKKRNKCC